MTLTLASHPAQAIIEKAFETASTVSPTTASSELSAAIDSVMDALDRGTMRVAEPRPGGWHVHEWIKKAVLLYFRTQEHQLFSDGVTHYYDKIPLKHQHHTQEAFRAQGARVVPSAMVRKGAYLAEGVVLMPCYVNIGAYIGRGTMIDTWATVGSCAQIGCNVHISGGTGIGGVLEPLQAQPTIIEDDCFIGARSEIVEGVIVEAGSVIAMGVFIGQSTRIYDRSTGKIFYGRVPAGSVVVPGSLPSRDGSCHLNCAIIVKNVDAKTRAKVGINALLRDTDS